MTRPSLHLNHKVLAILAWHFVKIISVTFAFSPTTPLHIFSLRPNHFKGELTPLTRHRHILRTGNFLSSDNNASPSNAPEVNPNFEQITSWALATESTRPITAEYDPDGTWLWTQWEGTIRQMTYKETLWNMLWALIVNFYTYYHYLVFVASASGNGVDGTLGDGMSISSLSERISWFSSDIRHSSDPFIEFLQSVNVFWEALLPLAVFTLSFFLNNAYDHWRSVYFSSRAVQGKINDLCLLVSAAAARTNSFGEVDGIVGYPTEVDDEGGNVKKLVQDITRLLRMSHTFFWADKPTLSDGLKDKKSLTSSSDVPYHVDESKLGSMLLSSRGLELMVQYGQLRQREVDALVATGLPPSKYSLVLLEWACIRTMEGIRSGQLQGGPGLESNLLQQFTQLRGEYSNIGDYASGRMPMAYLSGIQVIIDCIVFTAPLALYTKLGALSIVATGFFTIALKGLLELSKSFLDPFGIEGYNTHNIRVDVLVSELNFDVANLWVEVGDALPSEKGWECGNEQLQSFADEKPNLSQREMKLLDELNQVIADNSPESNVNGGSVNGFSAINGGDEIDGTDDIDGIDESNGISESGTHPD